MNGKVNEWEFLLNVYGATKSVSERITILDALADTHDKNLLKRFEFFSFIVVVSFSENNIPNYYSWIIYIIYILNCRDPGRSI